VEKRLAGPRAVGEGFRVAGASKVEWKRTGGGGRGVGLTMKRGNSQEGASLSALSVAAHGFGGSKRC